MITKKDLLKILESVDDDAPICVMNPMVNDWDIAREISITSSFQKKDGDYYTTDRVVIE